MAESLTTTFTLPPIDDGSGSKPKKRKGTITVREDANGRTSTLEVKGVGIGGHRARCRFDLDRDGHFDEILTFEWDGDTFTHSLPFIPLAAIVLVDGSDEIRL